MKKVQTRKKNGLLGLFAALTMAIGVGVSLAPRSATNVSAATMPATMTAGENGSAAKVNGKDAIKVGTRKNGGNMTITVGTGAVKLSFYAAAWNKETGLSLNLTGATAGTTSFSLTADSGVTGDSPFTLSGQESSYYFETTLSGITSETDITLTSTKRFVIWSASYEVAGGVAPESMELDTDTLNLDILDTHQLEPSFEPDGAIAGVDYVVSASNPAGVVSVDAFGLVTALKTGTATITATTTDGSNVSATVNVTVTSNYSSNILTPAEAQELATGADVLVRGKVVADIKNAGSYAIQVGDRGIMTYGINDLTVGNDYIIAAKMADYKGMPQISNASSVIDMGPSTTTVTPKVITDVSQLTANLSGTLVQINNAKYKSGTFDTNAASNVTLTLGTTDVAIRATKDVENSVINAANAIFNSAGPDDVLNITTVSGWFNAPQLLFSADTVIEKISPVFGILDRIELKTTSVKDSYYVGEEFSLDGLIVTAYDTANIGKIVTDDATSSLASGYTFVAGDIGSKTITISYEEEGVEKTETFNITIQAVPAWTTVTLQYSESTTTNFQDGNNASNVGLDSNLFNVVSLKGGQTNHIGMNKDGTLRLYSSSGNGSTLEVSIAAGKVISKIEFKFGGTVADAKVLVDDVEKFNAVPTSNGTLTIGNISGQKFSIQNVTSSGQLHIKSIDIYYESTSSYESEALAFATEVMTGSGLGAEGNCKAVLADLEAMYDGLSEMAQLEFETNPDELFVNARARLDYLKAWVALNDSTGSLSSQIKTESNTLVAALVIGAIGITTLGGYFFLNKKRHLEK